MNKLENGVIKYSIDFERYKNGQANEIVALLDKVDSELAKYIKQTSGVYTKARYKEIASKVREMAKALKEQVGNNIDVDGVIEYELKKQKKLLELSKSDISKTYGGAVNFRFPTKEQIRTSALFKPVTEGFTYDSYLNGIEAGFFNTWDSAVRTGYLTGLPTKQIVSNVIGGLSPATKLKNAGQMQALRNSIYGNTKTLLQSFASETRNQVYEENEQYFGDGEYKYEWLSALDSHTCIVCGQLDGKLFKTLKEAPSIPVHRGCRCILLPYFNIEGDKKASKDGYVDSKLTFEEWLKEQDEKTQIEVLGKTRYLMFKDGKTMSQFVDNGKSLTLEQIANRLEPDAKKFGINLFDKSDPIYVDAYSIEEEEGFTDIYVHGSKSSVQVMIDGKSVDLNVDEFTDYLKEKGYTIKGDIRLCSCSAGAGNNSFAQKLSKKLGVTVKAPNMDLYYAPNEGTLFVGYPVANVGSWRLFKNGEVIDNG